MLTRPERLALLLNLMGDEATDLARQGVNSDALDQLESALEDFQSYPPTSEEVDLVLDDFSLFFRMALDNAEQEADAEEEEQTHTLRLMHGTEEAFEMEHVQLKRFESPELVGDVVTDLNQMHPYQVARALRHESPITAAIVLRRLADEHAAKTLEFLPELMRPSVFMELATPCTAKSLVQERVLRKTLEMAMAVEQRDHDKDATDQMSNLVRSLPRKLRKPMLDELGERDAALAEAVRRKLYRFEDIEKLGNRDLQKLLGQCQTDTLVCALQKASEEMLEFVLANMSRRAKETLQEEMEFKTDASEDEIDEAQSALVTVLANLAESGEVRLD